MCCVANAGNKYSNLRVKDMNDLGDGGYQDMLTEPTCLHCLKHFLRALDDDDDEFSELGKDRR